MAPTSARLHRRSCRAPQTTSLNDGDVVDLGDRAFEVLHLPGHSPDSMGLFDRASGYALLDGGAIYDGPLLEKGSYRQADPSAYIATMERLRELPVTVVHGGHETELRPRPPRGDLRPRSSRECV